MKSFSVGISLVICLICPFLSASATDYEFSDVTAVAGVATETAPRHWAGSWADYNKDGLLDLYVANGSSFNPAALGATSPGVPAEIQTPRSQ